MRHITYVLSTSGCYLPNRLARLSQRFQVYSNQCKVRGLGATRGTERTSPSERPPSRGIVECFSFLFLFLSRVLLTASCSTQDEYDLHVPITVFPPHCPFPFPFPKNPFHLLLRALTRRPQTTSIDTKVAAWRRLYVPSFIQF
jgi:hypothetical protein